MSETHLQMKLLEDPRLTLYGRLFEAWASITQALDDQLLQEAGIPLTWYAVLLLLGRSPEGSRPIGELSLATAFTSGGVTRLVDRIEEAGYVERRRCPTDRRVIYVALTDSGRGMLEQATQVHLQGIQRLMVDRITPGEVEQLLTILAKLGAGDETRSACS